MHVRESNITWAKSAHPKQSTWQGNLELCLHPLPPTHHPLWICLVSWAHCCMAATLNLWTPKMHSFILFWLCQIGHVNCTHLLFPNELSNLPHPYISINQFCQATQFLIQSYHRKTNKNFCKTQNGGITSSLDVIGSWIMISIMSPLILELWHSVIKIT
jgi:hypothetical protein